MDLSPDSLPSVSPLDRYEVQAPLEAVVLGRCGSGGKGGRQGLGHLGNIVELSIKPSLLSAVKQVCRSSVHAVWGQSCH